MIFFIFKKNLFCQWRSLESMFNQTTPGWMRWSSLQSQLVSWIQLGCQPLQYCHSLHPARPVPLWGHCVWWQSGVIHGRASLCKKNYFTHSFPMPLYTGHSLMVGPHSTQTKTPRNSKVHLLPKQPQTQRLAHPPHCAHTNGKNKTGYSEAPPRHRAQEEKC